MKRPFKHACVGTLAACLAALAAALAAAQQASEPSDPIDLFIRLVPVFSHPRCVNCHGVIATDAERNAMAAVRHGGGVVTSINECRDCHNSSQRVIDAWRLADHESLRFAGKSPKQLCDMQSQEVRKRSRDRYYHHLEDDPLITQAFDGMAGGARDPDPPEKPPMLRNDFLLAARAWLDVGAGCGGWKGEITQTETFGSNYEYPMPGVQGTVQVTETAGREIKITRDDGVTKGAFTMSGHQTIVQTMRTDGCTIVLTSNGDWVSTTPANTDVDLTVSIANDGSYTIRFVGPIETTRNSSSGHMANDCGVPPFTEPHEPPIEIEWPPWAFTIRCPSDHGICQMFDPDNRTLSGTMERTILNHEDAADPHSRLTVSLAGISRADDGASLPVKVTTKWDLSLTN